MPRIDARGKRFFVVAICASLLAAFLGALRPTVLAALLSEKPWVDSFDGVEFPGFLKVGNIYALMGLEVLDFAAMAMQGVCLSIVAAGIGECHRRDLTQIAVKAMAGHADAVLSRYVGLCKSYVDTLEVFFRHSFVQSIAAAAQLLLGVGLAAVLNPAIALILVTEVMVLLMVTTFYGKVHRSLAQQYMSSSEVLLGNAALNPRKGLAIWYGGQSDAWVRRRLAEISDVARSRMRMWSGEAIFFSGTTGCAGAFTVVGYFILIGLGFGSIQDFIALVLYTGFMLGPIVRLAAVIPEYREYSLARDELSRVSDSVPGEIVSIKAGSRLQFSGVRAPLQRDSPIQEIEFGERSRLALIGPSGAGKTSAVMSLLGANSFALVDSKILGEPSTKFRFALPGARVRYLSETPVFEQGSIVDNCNKDFEACRRVAMDYGLFPTLDGSALDLFLNREILGSGEPLSLGERQRVQMLRCLLDQPRIVFMDEALSGVEEELERSIVAKLIACQAISTLVYIGHRSAIQGMFDVKIDLR